MFSSALLLLILTEGAPTGSQPGQPRVGPPAPSQLARGVCRRSHHVSARQRRLHGAVRGPVAGGCGHQVKRVGCVSCRVFFLLIDVCMLTLKHSYPVGPHLSTARRPGSSRCARGRGRERDGGQVLGMVRGAGQGVCVSSGVCDVVWCGVGWVDLIAGMPRGESGSSTSSRARHVCLEAEITHCAI
jgi:hypothetical protein